MKKFFTLLLILCTAAIVQAQAYIPNAGFEQWNNGSAMSWSSAFSYDATLTSFEYEAGERTSDSHTGNYAMKLHPAQIDLTITTYTLPGICHLGYFNTEFAATTLLGIMNGGVNGIIDALIEGGIPCNQIPSKATAWVKFIPSGDDEMTATVRCYSNGEVIAEGTYTSATANGTYQQIEIPVTATGTATPDQLNIIFGSGSTEGSYLYIDDVELFFEDPVTPGINECNAIFSVSPNPTSELLNITSTIGGNYSAKLFDANGKLVWEKSDLQGDTQVNTTGFTAGIYLLRVNNGGLSRTEKVVIR